MSGTPRVLALVPHLRYESGLEHCLTALVAQTRRPDGIVVLDDATPEPPIDVVRRFPVVTLWRAPRPLGLGALVEGAIARMRFDWYLLCDPHGWASPQLLERLLEQAESTDAVLIGGPVVTFGPSGATATSWPPADIAAFDDDRDARATRLLGTLARNAVLAPATTRELAPALHIVPEALSFRRARPRPAAASSAEEGSLDAQARLSGNSAAAWQRLAGPRLGRRRRWPWPILRQTSPSSRHGAEDPALLTAGLVGPGRPGFVVGTASGAEPLFWALAQHPAVRSIAGGSWVAPMADARASLLADVNERSPADAAGRPGGRQVDDLVTRTAAGFSAVAGGDRDPWVARLTGGRSALDAVLALFPKARVLHVVAEEPAAVARAPGQVREVSNKDLIQGGDETVERCLSFLGLPFHPSCALALAAAVGPLQEHGDVAADRGSMPGEVNDVPAHMTGPLDLLKDLPPVAVVAAVTKGDGALDAAADVAVRHFPQTADGEWAGYHPADAGAILRHLRTVQRRGATHFLVPAWSAWWLDHYEGLSEGLEAIARRIRQSEEGGHLYELLPDERHSRSKTPRRSVTVIAWDTSHNPLGRAHVLAELLSDRYDVEIVGARFSSFGKALWRPLRDADMTMRTFPGVPFPDFIAEVERFSRTITSDVLLVSKPRLPSLALGLLASVQRPRPVLLDIDDRELTFVGASEPLQLSDLEHMDESELSNPYGRQWTRVCESLVGLADEITVSNVALQRLFGGTVIPHARDERVFDPSRVDRQAARSQFGFAAEDRVVLFGGTPRRHKGVVELAAAVHALGDPRAKLCIIATDELRELRQHLAPYSDVLVEVPYQPFDRLPDLLTAVDTVAVLQDPQSEVSDFQMPAKITDAMAMQLPCIVRNVPPLAPLVEAGHLIDVGPDGLSATLERVLNDLGSRDRARSVREAFLQEYSFSAVRPRLEGLVETALSRPPEPRHRVRELEGVLRGLGHRAAGSTAGP